MENEPGDGAYRVWVPSSEVKDLLKFTFKFLYGETFRIGWILSHLREFQAFEVPSVVSGRP